MIDWEEFALQRGSTRGGNLEWIERRENALELAGAIESPIPEQSKWYRWRKDGKALVSYLLDSEVHTFAFSVAANAILSFIPFIALLYALQ